MGGLPWNGTTASNYLYTGQAYWTMTPYRVDSLGGVDVFSVDSTGALHSSFVDSMFGVRPVINLSADVKVTGSGTAGDPFVVL
ncbi:unknown [Mycoplasma sp. CAG:776]|nr:unknown [Mycoplasma sp. CAG:776]